MPAVTLGIREFVEFLLRTGSIDSRFTGVDRANEGSRIHRRLQKQGGEGYQSEVFVKWQGSACGVDYTLEGRADGIFPSEEGLLFVDEIKSTAVPTEKIEENMNPCHWAQGQVYAAIYCAQQGLDEMGVRLTYYQIDTDEIFRYQRRYTRQELQQFLQGLLEQYAPWACKTEKELLSRQESLRALQFPFPAYRPGQHAMTAEIYRALRDEKRIFVQAPTGIGKTISALFPALKLMAEGKGQKAFYLTARGTTQQAAQTALLLLRAQQPALALRTLTLTAKDKICLCKNEEGRPQCNPEACPYADGYYDRLRPALWAALDSQSDWNGEALSAFAKEQRICPFEFGLDLALWSDVILGDYNYLFDPAAALSRFFDSKGDWLFLIDEAHNLPDRARSSYSAALCKSEVLQARRALGKRKSQLKNALTKLNNLLLNYRSLLEQEAADDAFAAEGFAPYYRAKNTVFSRKPPDALLRTAQATLGPMQLWLEDHREGAAHETILQLYFTLRTFLRTADGYDEHYLMQLTARGAECKVNLLCMDPSLFIDACLSKGRGAALFSATLTPPSYYKALAGSSSTRAVALPSPFAQEHFGLVSASLSTRYKDRETTLPQVAAYLAAMANSRTGNYLAFFPSYAYLEMVQQALEQHFPSLQLHVQQSGMKEAERAAYLQAFEKTPTRSMLGLAVLGGVFGEGIDLVGDRLIGCAVVGVGLPQVNPEQEALRQYYDEQNGAGFDYAYRYPGMNKVLQAAGRVIRTAQDVGLVLLVDDRFGQPQYRRLMPPHWSHLEFVQTPDQLTQWCQRFWQKQP